jgi:hypothetical protein
VQGSITGIVIGLWHLVRSGAQASLVIRRIRFCFVISEDFRFREGRRLLCIVSHKREGREDGNIRCLPYHLIDDGEVI